ncbi:uncharacterized protein L969DRAFT_87798, partial [Mixia osmundae IAM 14324]|uniref:uncharacterized protein n=1 Tax=Mixia osmundae (strain CBS 9802 / IAM 14324 / JCM 22182 / KY 12970) TaxID=764103 RepID=UPI0004A555F8
FDGELLFYATSCDRRTARDHSGNLEEAHEYQGEAPSLVEARMWPTRRQQPLQTL